MNVWGTGGSFVCLWIRVGFDLLASENSGV